MTILLDPKRKGALYCCKTDCGRARQKIWNWAYAYNVQNMVVEI